MEFFKPNTKIDFLKLSIWAAIFSALMFLASMASLIVNGLNLGLDFTGGTQMELHFAQPVDVDHIRVQLHAAGFAKAEVQSYGDAEDVMITVAGSNRDMSATAAQELRDRVLEAVPGSHINNVSYIGAKVSSELAYKGVLAVFVAMLATMLYIAMRFEYRMGIGSAVALVHDPVIILGIFSFFHLAFDLTSLAAVLTIIGYSLNDTVVVFDRVRENFRKMRQGSAREVVNASVNQTLSRTIMSAGMTFIVVLALFFLGGATIHEFALALIIGIVVGTYSSIYVAGATAVALGLNRSHLLRTVKKETD